MKLPAFLPDAPAVAREAICVILGAVIAAAVIGQLPGLKVWIKEQWTS